MDTDGRLLLFADSDPGVPGHRWWITPGGGVEPGETDRSAAVRELFEETGAAVTGEQLIGPLAAKDAVHGYSDVIVYQRETYFGVVVPPFQVDDAGHTESERLTLVGHRWWRRPELAATTDDVWPRGLPRIWDNLDARIAGAGAIAMDAAAIARGTGCDGRWPEEESTVPVGPELVRALSAQRNPTR